jgi:sodium transport system ATP-binding protein
MTEQTADSAGIRAWNLAKVYQETRAVDGIDLCVGPGEIIGLLGPNGAGKTTTLRMLAGILRPTAGAISVCGHDVATAPLEVKRRIGFLSGDTQLYERLTVRETLRFFGRLHQVPGAELEARITALISELEMDDYSDRAIGTLSSGQGQRANIARTIVHDPQVLVLDEATTSLDVISSQFIIAALQRLRQAGKAILFSTHIMSEAEFLCDRIELIHNGRIIDRGTTEELLTRTGSENLTAAFLARVRPQADPDTETAEEAHTSA